ncbi:MAG TPA: hypothetical protein DCM05_02260 [Elusimicrobia bacterium]|nr:hypothetical protein [Elusimicrobiota bacterium]
MRALPAALLAFALPASAQIQDTGTFTYLLDRPWTSMDPARTAEASDFLLAGNVYEPLLAFLGERQSEVFLPLLAEDIPSHENGLLSEDRLVAAFPVRKGVRLHGGSELSAEDVRYSFLRAMIYADEGSAASILLGLLAGRPDSPDPRVLPASELKAAFDAVEARKGALVLRFKRPVPLLLKLIASMPVMTSKDWALAQGDWDGSEADWYARLAERPAKSPLDARMNGTGPYRLEKADSGDALLARHEGYWRKPAALRRAALRVVPSAGERILRLEAADADAADMEDAFARRAKGYPGIRWAESPPLGRLGKLVLFNLRVSSASPFVGSGVLDGKGLPADLFAERAVRQAFSFLFDYERYHREALGSSGRRTDGPFPPALLETAARPRWKKDLARAAALLKGVRGGALWRKGFVLPIAFDAGSPAELVAARVLQAGLESLGPQFRARLHPMERERLRRELDARTLPLAVADFSAEIPDLAAFAYPLLHSGGRLARRQGYSSPGLDALIDEAASSEDPKARRRAWAKVLRRAQEDVPQIWTYSPAEFEACRAGVKGCGNEENVAGLGFLGLPYFYAYSE